VNRLRWVIENGGDRLLNKGGPVYLCWFSDGIGGGTGYFLYPLHLLNTFLAPFFFISYFLFLFFLLLFSFV
jgi:hypothetical protein